MQVHLLPQRLAPLARIHELPADVEAEADVIRATAPFEIPDVGDGGVVAVREHLGPSSVVRLAVAGVYGAFAARPRYGVRYCGGGDGVDEGGLPATYKRRKSLIFYAENGFESARMYQ